MPDNSELLDQISALNHAVKELLKVPGNKAAYDEVKAFRDLDGHNKAYKDCLSNLLNLPTDPEN